jgi:hypothetical protein
MKAKLDSHIDWSIANLHSSMDTPPPIPKFPSDPPPLAGGEKTLFKAKITLNQTFRKPIWHFSFSLSNTFLQNQLSSKE